MIVSFQELRRRLVVAPDVLYMRFNKMCDVRGRHYTRLTSATRKKNCRKFWGRWAYIRSCGEGMYTVTSERGDNRQNVVCEIYH